MSHPAKIPTFPCAALPDDGPSQRLLGLCPQAQDGLWMQRLKVLGGRLTADQWRTLARVAEELTPASPLHLTTRQDVELHNLTSDRVPAAQQALARAGLTGLGAGGDTLRNITVCPCSGAAAGAADLLPLAGQICREIEKVEGIFALPRKFKVSLSACEEACGQPWINDLGLVAHRRAGPWRFEVVAGGSLGPRPATARRLFDALAPDDVLPCAVAMVRLFAAHGDREHRGRARLRHVRERFGDEQFAAMAREALEAARSAEAWPAVDLRETAGPFVARRGLVFANGDVTPEQALALADLSQREESCVRIGAHHQVIVFGRSEAAMEAAVEGQPALAATWRPQPVIVACPGNRWCKHGLVDTNALANRLRLLGPEVLSPGTTVCISGCPNGCAHSAVADVGLIGARVPADGGSRDGYHLSTGGGMGRNDRLAVLTARGLSPDEVAAWLAQRR